MFDLRQAHLIGTYLLLFLGTTGMWLGESEDVFPYPLVVLVCSVVAYLLVDRWNLLRLSPLASNGVALLVLLLMIHELRNETSTVLLALAHFLVYLQLAKYFRPKSDSDFWLLYAINALQVAVSCVINYRMVFGLLLVLYSLLAIVVLTLFYLKRHTDRLARPMYVASTPALPARSHQPRSNVLGSMPRLAGQLSIAWLGCILLALPLFWVIPRTASEQGRRRGLAAPTESSRAVTGFSESIELDELQSVMENDEIVLSVWCRDRTGKPAPLPDGIFWRGVVFTRYHQRGWRGTPTVFAHQIGRLSVAPPFEDDQLELTIEQSRAAGHYLFSPRPVLWVKLDDPNLVTFCERTEGRLFVRGPPELGKRGVASTSSKIRISTVELENDPSMSRDLRPEYAKLTKEVPAHLQRLRLLATELTSDLDEDDVLGKIDRVVGYLSDLSRFQYTLDLRPVDRTIDPIEDFLFNRKAGHCEYFASSAALLLRASGISTRVVNGFKGADLNETGGFYQVPQLLAHAWVEAYDPGSRRWLTVDPTPGESRELGLAGRRNLPATIRNLLHLANRYWDRYFVEFSAVDQASVVTAFTTEGIWDAFSNWVADRAWSVSKSPRLGQREWRWTSVVLYVASSLLLAVAAFRFGWQRWRRRKRALCAATSLPAEPSYGEWIALLETKGIYRQPEQTPLEFAREIEEKLTQFPELIDDRHLPSELTQLHYSVRFGMHPIDESSTKRFSARIARIGRDALLHLARCVLDSRNDNSSGTSKTSASLVPPN